MSGARNVPHLGPDYWIRSGDASLRAIVVVQQSAETLTTPNPTAADLHGRRAVDEFVPEALVIALAVIVLYKLADRPSQVALPKWDRPVETFVFDACGPLGA
jgi:hypothetical protein